LRSLTRETAPRVRRKHGSPPAGNEHTADSKSHRPAHVAARGPAEGTCPQNAELGADLQRLERRQRAAEDRRRTEELARLGALQGRD